MTATRYVALLRGINVGGNNLISMASLRACFERQGFADVATYIASGNVLFSAPERNAAKLAKAIEKRLCADFAHYSASIVLRSSEQMQAVLETAPRGFGKAPARFRYDVAFLKGPLTAEEIFPQLPLREGVDRAWAGDGVLYFARLVARVTHSRISRLIQLPAYQQMTLRNWNTTAKLASLLGRT